MIVIIDYGMGNLGSIANMFVHINAEALVSSSPEAILAADKLVLPGVGAFDAGMRSLHERGLIPVLEQKVLQDHTPILGICLGMQLFTQGSEEGELHGLGWIDAQTKRFRFENQADRRLRIPHMGWNTIEIRRPHPLMEAMHPEPRYYFVHSYYVQCTHPEDVVAATYYGLHFDAIVAHQNVMGTQFHPEKSHKYGIKLLENFVEMQHAFA